MESAADLMDFVCGGGLVVTASSRASRALRRRYAQLQASLGVSAWVSPAIVDWANWLNGFWQAHLFAATSPPLILSALQELWLWKRILDTQPESRHVLSVDALAALAQQAYSLLSEYDAHPQRQHPWSIRGDDSISDPEAFRRWASAFDSECRKRNVASASDLAPMLVKAIQSGLVTLPAEVQLLGFDRLTPSQNNLLAALRNGGCAIKSVDQKAPSQALHWVVAQNRRDEIVTCAAWLRQSLLASPDQRIALIAPDVASAREEIDRTFRRILAPESMIVATKPAPLPFEFSLGVSLSTVPMARAALLLLHWIDAPLIAEELSWLMLSGVVTTTDTDTMMLARLDSTMRNSGLMQPLISLAAFLKQLTRHGSESANRLYNRLAGMQKASQGKVQREAREWTEVAQDLLTNVGWPGLSEGDSVEFQVRQKFIQLLESMASLGFDNSLMSYHEFLSFLEKQAEETIFAPESRDAQVQILGPAESSGQTFNSVWFMSLDESNWPASGRPHPMLPGPVQRKAGMPYTDAVADSALARAITLRIAASATTVVFSYSRQDKDGALRPSPLLAELDHLPPIENAASFRHQFHLQLEPPPIDRTERTLDSDPVPWPAEKRAGGFSILKRQSACPFQSFAAKRLAIGEMDDAQWGLSPMQRGELLHAVMETIWTSAPGTASHLHSLDDLLSATRENRLDELVSKKLDDVFHKHACTQAQDAWSRAYLASEQKRLHTLINVWLRYEALRQPFEVEACEKELEDVPVGDLHLRLRVDRVDLLPEGKRILIDYKTSEVSTAMWNSPRINEPQLPLYATYGGLNDVEGILFAQIRAGKQRFVGHLLDARQQLFSNLDGKSALLKSPLDSLMVNDWKDDLLNLANDFLRGDATVDPKQFPATCKYCGFTALCRVMETGAPLVQVDAADADGNGEETHD